MKSPSLAGSSEGTPIEIIISLIMTELEKVMMFNSVLAYKMVTERLRCLKLTKLTMRYRKERKRLNHADQAVNLSQNQFWDD